MRDKSNREMRFSTDSSDLDQQNQRMRRARGSSVTFRDGNLIDLSDHEKQITMESSQEDVENLTSNDASAGKDKSSFASPVSGIWSRFRGNPQTPHVKASDQQVNTRSKLEADLVALQKNYEALKKDSRYNVSENKQLRSQFNNAVDQLEETETHARKEAQRHQTDIKSAKAHIVLLKSDLETAKEKIVDLEFDITAADKKFRIAEIAAAEDISRLTSDIDTANEELYRERRSTLEEIERLQSQIKLLNETNDKFRQMLIPVSQEQLLDATVIQKFKTLRFSIMALVRGTWKLELRNNVDVRHFSNDQYHAFQSIGPASYDRLRYVVFHYIYQAIFNAKNYFLEDGFESFEEHLQQVEKGLREKSSSENAKLLLEWRNASFKVTDTFRGDGRRLSRETQSNIWGFLSPLEMVDDAAEAKGKKKLEEVCDAAISLSLTIRQSRDNFWVDDMDKAVGQPISLWDKFTEEMATVPASDGKQPGTIAYVISGALIKNPKEDMEQVLVLQKAEAAVYR